MMLHDTFLSRFGPPVLITRAGLYFFYDRQPGRGLSE